MFLGTPLTFANINTDFRFKDCSECQICGVGAGKMNSKIDRIAMESRYIWVHNTNLRELASFSAANNLSRLLGNESHFKFSVGLSFLSFQGSFLDVSSLVVYISAVWGRSSRILRVAKSNASPFAFLRRSPTSLIDTPTNFSFLHSHPK